MSRERESVIINIKTILLQWKDSGGLTSKDLNHQMSRKFGRAIDPGLFGYHQLDDFLQVLDREGHVKVELESGRVSLTERDLEEFSRPMTQIAKKSPPKPPPKPKNSPPIGKKDIQTWQRNHHTSAKTSIFFSMLEEIGKRFCRPSIL